MDCALSHHCLPESIYYCEDTKKLSGKDDSFKGDELAFVLGNPILLQWASGGWVGN